MAGADENVAVMGDWPSSNPSPRTFFSSLFNDDFSSKQFQDMMADNGCQASAPEAAMRISPDNSPKEGNQNAAEASGDPSSESNMFSDKKPPTRSSLAERMAARAGFNAPRLNTDSIRSASMPSSSPEVRFPYLTIPPGLSPTTLLDSPVFLSSSLTQQSPTTGKFSFGPFGDGGFISVSTAPAKAKDAPFEPFAFKPTLDSNSMCFSSGENKVAVPTTYRQSLPSIEVSVQPAVQVPSQNLPTTEVYSQTEQEFCSQQTIPDSSSCKDAAALRVPQHIHNNAENSPPFDDQEDGNQKGEFSTVVVGTPAEDGYNWRKYGQKHVKGSEFPRSYYKCTHPNCQVKKKVERSHEGHITEIIYEGAHNHPKPPPNRRAGIGSSQSFNEGDTNAAQQASQPGLDGEQATWANDQNGNANGGADWMITDGMDRGPSGSASTELCDPSTSMHGPGGMETHDARDVSSTMSNEEDDDDRVTHGSVSLGGEDEGDESESKRRKMDACVMEMSGAARAIREPRVVVQTTSEVDILDDGYRWRKYGQKVVKGNPNPRSYYKCTNAGCTVRKHVERASHDLKSVITTYEGKHNHDVPAARNSSHVNSAPSTTAPAPPPFIPRAEPSQVYDSLPRFERQTMLNTFNLPGRSQQMAPIPGFSFGMGHPNLSSLAMASFGPAAQGKLAGFPMHHSYLGQQQQQQSLRKPNEWGLMMPKGEPKEEPPLESGLPVTNASAVYHQLMSRMPLGPQL